MLIVGEDSMCESAYICECKVTIKIVIKWQWASQYGADFLIKKNKI